MIKIKRYIALLLMLVCLTGCQTNSVENHPKIRDEQLHHSIIYKEKIPKRHNTYFTAHIKQIKLEQKTPKTIENIGKYKALHENTTN